MLTAKNPTNRSVLYIVAILAYLALALFGFYLLAISKTGANIQSPWQTIHPAYIYVFFAATFLLGLIIFFHKVTPTPLGSPSGRGTGQVTLTILLLLTLHCLLFHSYLPLTHNLLYGADQWRHIAVESRIMSGLPYLTPKLSDGTTGNVFNNILGRVSYSGMWYVSAGAASIVQALTNSDITSSLILVNKWLVPIWWSLTVPLLLYLLGRALDWDQRKSLFLSWLGFLPFAMQAPGAMTLPVSFSFPLFLAGLVLLLKRLKSPERKWLLWLLILGIIISLNYILYAVLFWLGWLVAEIVRQSSLVGAWSPRPGVVNEQTKAGRPRPYVAIVCFVLMIAVLPILEYIAGYSYFDSSIHWFAQIKQLIGNFTAAYIANGPRPHTIDAGNIIFNQIPSYAFVFNYFTAWRWWLIGFMVLFLVLAKYGAWQLWRAKLTQNVWLVLFGSGLFISYVISRYFLVGEQVLTRRLDTTLALFLIIFVTNGFWEIVKKYGNKEINGRQLFPYIHISIFLIFSIAIAASYSFGPNSQTISFSDYQNMRYVWSREKNDSTHCVLSDTYSLLTLEAISSKEIIGGGFPINAYFKQPEREAIFNGLKADILSKTLINQALKITRASYCLMSHKGFVLISNGSAWYDSFGEFHKW